MPDPVQPIMDQSYDFSKLHHGTLFDVSKDKRFTWIYFILVLTPIVVAAILPGSGSSAALPNTANHILRWYGPILFLVVGAMFVYGLLWQGILRGLLYRRSRQAFANKYGLQPVADSLLLAQVPASLRNSGAHSIKASGYQLNFAHTGITVFDYSYSVGSGKNRRDYWYAVATLSFSDETYPHLFLDSHQNGGNHTYTKNQRVELEGDFSKYFDLYIPDGSQAGALTIFSPDVMQTLLDFGRPFDIEIQGQEVALITQGYAFTRDNIQKILVCAAKLSREFQELNLSWQPEIAATGQQFVLKRRSTLVITIVIVVIYIALQVLPRILRSQ